jgi:spore maturation protein SpmA
MKTLIWLVLVLVSFVAGSIVGPKVIRAATEKAIDVSYEVQDTLRSTIKR